jgi:hypothetical protein
MVASRKGSRSNANTAPTTPAKPESRAASPAAAPALEASAKKSLVEPEWLTPAVDSRKRSRRWRRPSHAAKHGCDRQNKPRRSSVQEAGCAPPSTGEEGSR